MRKFSYMTGLVLFLLSSVMIAGEQSDHRTQIQGKMGVYAISPAELAPLGSLLDHISYSMDYHIGWTSTYPEQNTSNTFTFAAPVHLPDGVTVNTLEVYVTDDDGDSLNWMEISLSRAKFDELTSDVNLATVWTKYLSSSSDRILLTDDSIANAKIDNDNYSYVLRIVYNGPHPWLIFHGAKITYR